MTNEPRRAVSPDRISRVRRSNSHHFSITDSEANAPRLLRKVADAIEELGEIELLDVTFCVETEGSQFEATMTVYLGFPDEE